MPRASPSIPSCPPSEGRLELSLADVRHKLAGAGTAGYGEMLRRAEAALEKELSGLK